MSEKVKAIIADYEKDIDSLDIESAKDELLKAMANGGFETEIKLTVTFALDHNGEPFIRVGNKNSQAIRINENLLDCLCNPRISKENIAEFMYPKQASFAEPPNLLPEQKEALINSLINLKSLASKGIYKAVEDFIYLAVFNENLPKDERKKIKRYAEHSHEKRNFLTDILQTEIRGRNNKSQDDLRDEKEKFLKDIHKDFCAGIFNNPSQKNFAIKTERAEKNFSVSLKRYGLSFKELKKQKHLSETEFLNKFL